MKKLLFLLLFSFSIVAFGASSYVPPLGWRQYMATNSPGSVVATNADTAALATNAINSTNFWGLLSYTNIPTVANATNSQTATSAINATNLYSGTNTVADVGSRLNGVGFTNGAITASQGLTIGSGASVLSLYNGADEVIAGFANSNWFGDFLGATNMFGTNLNNGGSSAGQLLTATATGVAWSNMPTLRTNNVSGVPTAGTIATAATDGGIWWSNAPAGSGTTTVINVYTNGQDENGIVTNWGSSTWTKPANAQIVRVIAVGGGAGGGSGRRGAADSARYGGGGGASGAFIDITLLASSCGATETVTVGTNGIGGAAKTSDDTSGSNGTSGSMTSFGSLVTADFGTFGCGGSASAGVAGWMPGVGGYTVNGGGGGASSITGTGAGGGSPGAGAGAGGIDSSNVQRAGGNGGSIRLPVFVAGGTGGTAGGTAGGNGTSRSAGIPHQGSGGGGGGGNASGAGGNGGNGGNYGGGGGGGGASLNGSNSGAGGNGAPGIVIVITTISQ